MNASFSFGSYYPAESFVHALDPRTKLVAGAMLVAAVLTAQDFAGLAVAAAFVAAAYLAARVPVAAAARSIVPLLPIVALAAAFNLLFTQGGPVVFQWLFVTVSETGAAKAAFIGCRLFIMMAGMSLVALTTAANDLACGFERLLSPLTRIGLPVHELSMMLGIAMRFMPQFADELANTYRAQICRGAKPGVRMAASLIVPLFSSVLRRAETLAFAMDARCYHGAGATRLHPLRFAGRDAAAGALCAGLIACVAGIGMV